MAKLTGAQAAVESLRVQGVDTIFGIISTHMMGIYDSLFHNQDSIRFISTRHEHAAAIMADGYARVTGKPGVCLTSTGPGAANSVGGMGEAFWASSPVLNLTSTAEEGVYGRGLGAIHETKDQIGMFNSVTDWSCHISHAEDVPGRLYEAFERFNTRRPRPIEIEIAVDVQGQTAEMEVSQINRFQAPEADSASVEKAAKLLLSGKRVAILAGCGVHRSGASAELIRLTEFLGIAVINTGAGKGAIPDDHRLSVGGTGGMGGPKPSPLKAFWDSLDTLLIVGSSMAYSRTKAAGLQLPPSVVHVDIDPEAIGRVYDVTVGVVGDARVALGQINDAIQGKSAQIEPGFDTEIAGIKKGIKDHWREAMPNEVRTMEAIRGAVARDAIFMGDVTIPIHRGATNLLEIYEPRTYNAPQWNGLGFAFAAAAGAKAGLPDRQVVCITGDGGFQFNIQEIGTCVQYGLNPVVLVFNDNAWGVLKDRQRVSYNNNYFGVELQNPDFVKLAESYGANGVRVESVKELVPAIEAGVKSDTITIVDVQTPKGFANFT